MAGDITEPSRTAPVPAKPSALAPKLVPPVPSVAKPTAVPAPVAKPPVSKPPVSQPTFAETNNAALTDSLPKIPPTPVSPVTPVASKAAAPVAAAPAPTPAVETPATAEAASPQMAESGRVEIPRSTETAPGVTPTAPAGAPELSALKPNPPALKQATMETAMTTTEDFMNQGQANVEAMIKASQIWTSGFQDLSRTLAESAQAQFDHNLATWKALTGTKSIKEAFDIQSTRARAALEKAVADTGRLTDASMKLAEQTMAPITARLTVATDKFVRVD